MSKYSDLATLHMMAMRNVAGLTFEEHERRAKAYREHCDMCIKKYGVIESLNAKHYGVPPPSTGGSDA